MYLNLNNIIVSLLFLLIIYTTQQQKILVNQYLNLKLV
jgi:hypothetical protein